MMCTSWGLGSSQRPFSCKCSRNGNPLASRRGSDETGWVCCEKPVPMRVAVGVYTRCRCCPVQVP